MAQTSFSLKYETEFTERYASQFYEGPVTSLLEEMRDAAGKAMRGVIEHRRACPLQPDAILA
jgi:hypothetical protein